MTVHPSILPYSTWFYGKTALTAYKVDLHLLRSGITDFSAEQALRISRAEESEAETNGLNHHNQL